MTLDDIAEVLDQCKNYDRYLSGICPFHDDNSPSLLVYPNGYVCKSCGAKGTLLGLYKKLGATVLTYKKNPRAYESPNWKRWFFNFGDLQNLVEFSHKNLRRNPEHLVYLKQRKVDQAVDDYFIGYIDGFYLFPLFDRFGNLISAVARCGPEHANPHNRRYFRCPGRGNVVTFPENSTLKNEKHLFVTFGIMDWYTLLVNGYPAVTSNSGKNFPANFLKFWRKKIYILPDRGEEKDARKLASEFGWRGQVVKISWEKGLSDMNDILVKKGSAALAEVLSHA